jgi:hypothetical protein
MPIPRFEGYRLHSDARSGRAIFRCGDDHGMESVYHGAHVEALGSHRTCRAATSCQRAKSGWFSGRWGTKLGTLKRHNCGNFLTNLKSLAPRARFELATLRLAAFGFAHSVCRLYLQSATETKHLAIQWPLMGTQRPFRFDSSETVEK